MFQHVEPFGGDPILSLNEDFQRDPRPHKINLSIGIYFDDEGFGNFSGIGGAADNASRRHGPGRPLSRHWRSAMHEAHARLRATHICSVSRPNDAIVRAATRARNAGRTAQGDA